MEFSGRINGKAWLRDTGMKGTEGGKGGREGGKKEKGKEVKGRRN